MVEEKTKMMMTSSPQSSFIRNLGVKNIRVLMGVQDVPGIWRDQAIPAEVVVFSGGDGERRLFLRIPQMSSPTVENALFVVEMVEGTEFNVPYSMLTHPEAVSQDLEGRYWRDLGVSEDDFMNTVFEQYGRQWFDINKHNILGK